MKKKLLLPFTVFVFISSVVTAVTIDWVTVGNPFNANDSTGYGSVSEAYRIGTYEVTAGQYTEFLNAVAATDTYNLYNTSMWSEGDGCKIERSGSSGSYTYSVDPGYANRPVNYVSWYDCLRFVNWLHNGQPTGSQNETTTEDGAYDMSLGDSVGRKHGAWVWLPDENEWYKAAYHKNDGVTGNYFEYPTSSDSVPSNNLIDPDPGNNATFYQVGYTIGSPYYRTEVGAHENSDSPYGTFDMGGNVWEWNETLIGSNRGVRGGAYLGHDGHLSSSTRYDVDIPDGGTSAIGFRVASVPACPSADLTGDCFVGLDDFAEFAFQWLTGNGDEILTEMVFIPGGAFQMGDHFDEGLSHELPVHEVTLDSFHMGRYEITNQMYCDYLNSALGLGLITVNSDIVYQAGSGTNYPYCDTYQSSTDSQISWNGSTFSVRSKNGRSMTNDPMVMVSWYGAVAYCNWRSQQEAKEPCYDLSAWTCDFSKNGYHLPTEAQWEYAARGGLAGRRFPWGDTISHTQANYYSSTSYSYDISPTSGFHPLWNDGIYPYTCPVGFFDGYLQYKTDYDWPSSLTSYQTANGVNGYGLYDMADNVQEFCNDWYLDTYYTTSPETNPTGPTTGTERVIRGGVWSIDATHCRAAYRGKYAPGDCHFGKGFRISLDL